MPADIGLSIDARTLGVHVCGLTIDDGFGTPRRISADDARPRSSDIDARPSLSHCCNAPALTLASNVTF